MIPSFLVMALIIGVRLRKTVLMDHNERIAGTRMVWYLVEAAIIYILILPFWIQAMTGSFDNNFTSSRLAEFVLFGSGSVICITHFLLRANAARMAIKPSRTPWMKKRKYRFFGPSDLEIINISPPIMKETMELEPEDKWRSRAYGLGSATSPSDTSPNSSVVGSSVVNGSSPKAVLLRKNWPLLDDMERPPTPAKAARVRRKSLLPLAKHKRQTSYSLFPGEDDLRLPATTYSPLNSNGSSIPGDMMTAGRPPMPSLLPPFRPFAMDGSRESTVTLEVGMRFSSAPAAARSRTPPTEVKRPSLLTTIDDMLRDTTAAQGFDPSPSAQHESSYPSSPFTSEQQNPAPVLHRQGHRYQPSAEDSIKYAWAETPDLQNQETTTNSPDAVSPTSGPLRTQANRSSTVYLSRSESLRRQAENNRLELASLARSGSGASKSRLRPAYPNG
jgi:hypothetical protein